METGIIFRAAKRADRRDIWRLVWQARLNPLGLKWQRFRVAVAGGEVIACAQIKPHRDGSQELASLVVAEEYRHQGIASRLVESLIQTHQGDLYLMCRASLGDFYRKFGFDTPSGGDLPPFFARVSRLAQFFHNAAQDGDGLLIMKR